ncbi:hypothetical protein [Actinomyces radicidentis]|uniref:hypothetical protein n=1 Tax=Actinomyces radicidentis TaxID=111015 RepID=UPI0028E58350|nr:hypothetical protein [Actinomyces radicidentis]
MSISVGVPGSPGRPGEQPASASKKGLGAGFATPGTQRLPAQRHTRRNTQVRRNAVVLAWVLAAAVLGLLVVGGPLADWGQWLPLHTLLLGGIGSAITIWSAHFADTLLHRPALGGAALLDARLYAHSAGSLLVLIGITAGWQVLAMVGVTVVMLAALAGVLAIGVQYRRAVAPRLAALAVHYAVALLLLAVGATLGYLTSWAETRGGVHLADVLYVSHTMTMLLGFVGTTVLGTLTVLWPTMLRTKMEVEAPRWTSRGLPVIVVGTVLLVCSGLWTPLAAIGALVYLAGACGVVVPAARTARRVPPSSFAAASAAAAVVWFLACVVRIGIGITLAGDASGARDVIHGVRVALGAGFALQVLAAALSYLTPVMLGGGPATTRATNAIMDRAAAYRVTATNACLLLAVLPFLSWPVRATAALVAGAVACYVLVGMGLSGRELVRRSRRKDDDVVALTIPVGPPQGATGGAMLPVGGLSPRAGAPVGGPAVGAPGARPVVGQRIIPTARPGGAAASMPLADLARLAQAGAGPSAPEAPAAPTSTSDGADHPAAPSTRPADGDDAAPQDATTSTEEPTDE